MSYLLIPSGGAHVPFAVEHDTWIQNLAEDAGDLVDDLAHEERHQAEWPKRERFLLLNPLSQMWTWRAIQEDPTRICGLGILYASGVIGYAFALPIRIIFFVREIFRLPIFFFKNIFFEGGRNFSGVMETRVLCLAGAAGEVASGVIGLVCPPIAYWIDEKIQSNQIIGDNSGLRGLWKELDQSPWEGADTSASDNGDRLVNKMEYLAPILPCFQRAVGHLQIYFKDDELAVQAPRTLYQVCFIGMLLAFKDELESNSHANFLDSIETYLKAYLPKFFFQKIQDNGSSSSYYINGKGESIEDEQIGYLNNWNACIADGNHSTDLVELLLLRATQDILGEDELSLGEGSYKEGMQAVLEDALNLTSQNVDFEPLYRVFWEMSNAIFSSDNELFTAVCHSSGLETLT